MSDDLDRADKALSNLSAHRCFTSAIGIGDVPIAVICLCARGVDHDEDEFDVPIGDTDE